MLKEVFNHPDVQGRANPQIHEVEKLVEQFDLLEYLSDPTFAIVTKDPMLQIIAEQRGVARCDHEHRRSVDGAKNPQGS